MRRTRTRGFRVVRVFRWVCRSKRRRRSNGYERLLDASDYKTSTITKIYSWGQSLKRKALRICRARPAESLDYCSLGQMSHGGDPFEPRKSVEVPKGHLAVYVGKKDDDPHRVLVPIIYFNHPLFGELLREAEKEFGYNHPGRITIPCPISEFERVKTTIAEGRKLTSKSHRD